MTCPRDFKECEFTAARQFNLMFKTHAGPVEDDGAVAYLRPETAQGMFMNFKNVLQTTRKKPPFGIAQVGKSFRNEITPGNFVFRTREFEQMEMEFFVPPDEGPKWYEYWCARAGALVTSTSASRADLLRLRAHDADELSHYSAGTSDVEFLFPWGWDELEGIANRTDYDLTQHAKHSGERLEYFDQATNERYVPARHRAGGRRDPDDDGVPPRGLRRGGGRRRARTVLRLHRGSRRTRSPCCRCRRRSTLAPRGPEVLGAVQPHCMTDYDDTQSIGRRYRRQDEIGTPSASPSTSSPSRTRRSRSATATPWSRSASRSTSLVERPRRRLDVLARQGTPPPPEVRGQRGRRSARPRVAGPAVGGSATEELAAAGLRARSRPPRRRRGPPRLGCSRRSACQAERSARCRGRPARRSVSSLPTASSEAAGRSRRAGLAERQVVDERRASSPQRR